MTAAPDFDDAFRAQLANLLTWRRDVRAFRSDPLPETVLGKLIAQAARAPSVGNSQPSRFVMVRSAERRRALVAHVEAEQIAAGEKYDAAERAEYQRLKLHGLAECPVVIAIYCVRDPAEGAGLGRQTMPEALVYSTICAVHTLWLAARAEGIGLGWVSILDPATVSVLLDVPADWHFIGILCLGYPKTEAELPLLHTTGWQARLAVEAMVIER
ncbi:MULTISPECIES: 5,6-dimethylbenzimidazole synthase [Sphingomonadales]|jgi:5,6-dimethylbenzimidazole synthase|uniref:Cob(II)yrinic acid a,c-diamide reductase n=1 Tax=Blastomonas natatoria TaxID=34015 RepID=A0A2V3V4T0_9SPHN|nr:MULTISPECIES: 5,6-dimethylbenzimidazole synthase [Sphingomonadales]MBA4010175.1 5,6-dimethylbenzimidazole synthase [Erythrobacter sp.]MBA4040483.1 5,6-dimethylbenzimidazole synthase [Sphingobium sp.]MDK2758724.1 5,6-dimethylbenzimidazole synthase [Blastomonas fulva]PXW69788.1 cob(II)yrinic acid a,c-diamide reductase [Blastomonas natatoria]